MKVYIIVYNCEFDMYPSKKFIFSENCAYKDRATAQKYWRKLGKSACVFEIKELEILEE